MTNEKIALTGSLAFLLFCLLAFGGWCANIYKLASGIDVISTTEAIIRGVGVIAAPLGCLAGYF